MTDTIITAALRTSGLTAPAIFEGATNGRRFLDYVTDTLVPAPRPRDTVILDNLQAHKVEGVREAIAAAGARVVYLPPYSPEFNRIEQALAKLKTLLRTAAARTVERCRTRSSKPSPPAPRRSAATTSMQPDTRMTATFQTDRATLAWFLAGLRHLPATLPTG